MSEYTADDFANARFAEHSDGTYGARTHPHMSMWSIYDKKRQMVNSYTDKDMARFSFRPVRESAPLTLDTLREAWENAIGSTTVHVGDTIIQRDPLGGSFSVFEAERDYPPPPLDIRILHRAPQPEPWQALADVLGGVMLLDGVTPGRVRGIAQNLHERGVRVVGGDET